MKRTLSLLIPILICCPTNGQRKDANYDQAKALLCSSQPNPANARQRPLLYGGSLAVITMGTDGSDHLFLTTDLGAHWTERDAPRS